jgi:fibronectin type 3 domain-containing protein
VESSDSAAAILTPKDTFPPEAPQNLTATVVPATQEGVFVVELSWSINIESDLAGYRVYRSETEGARGQLLTSELLPSPSHRDTSVRVGRRYWYTATAVDRAGNESSDSLAVSAEIPQLNP